MFARDLGSFGQFYGVLICQEWDRAASAMKVAQWLNHTGLNNLGLYLRFQTRFELYDLVISDNVLKGRESTNVISQNICYIQL